jgi:hypothetical protein
MKTIQRSFIAMALVLGIGGAFASNAHQAHRPASKNVDLLWRFDGTQAQINDATKYTQVTEDPGCSGSTKRCSIQAPENPLHANQPDLSAISQEEFKN